MSLATGAVDDAFGKHEARKTTTTMMASSLTSTTADDHRLPAMAPSPHSSPRIPRRTRSPGSRSHSREEALGPSSAKPLVGPYGGGSDVDNDDSAKDDDNGDDDGGDNNDMGECANDDDGDSDSGKDVDSGDEGAIHNQGTHPPGSGQKASNINARTDIPAHAGDVDARLAQHSYDDLDPRAHQGDHGQMHVRPSSYGVDKRYAQGAPAAAGDNPVDDRPERGEQRRRRTPPDDRPKRVQQQGLMYDAGIAHHTQHSDHGGSRDEALYAHEEAMHEDPGRAHHPIPIHTSARSTDGGGNHYASGARCSHSNDSGRTHVATPHMGMPRPVPRHRPLGSTGERSGADGGSNLEDASAKPYGPGQHIWHDRSVHEFGNHNYNYGTPASGMAVNLRPSAPGGLSRPVASSPMHPPRAMTPMPQSGFAPPDRHPARQMLARPRPFDVATSSHSTPSSSEWSAVPSSWNRDKDAWAHRSAMAFSTPFAGATGRDARDGAPRPWLPHLPPPNQPAPLVESRRCRTGNRGDNDGDGSSVQRCGRDDVPLVAVSESARGQASYIHASPPVGGTYGRAPHHGRPLAYAVPQPPPPAAAAAAAADLFGGTTAFIGGHATAVRGGMNDQDDDDDEDPYGDHIAIDEDDPMHELEGTTVAWHQGADSVYAYDDYKPGRATVASRSEHRRRQRRHQRNSADADRKAAASAGSETDGNYRGSQRVREAAAPMNVPTAPITPMLPLHETPEDLDAIHALLCNQRYQLVRRLGSGSFSTVFQACDRNHDNAYVAIKVVTAAKVSRSEILAGVLLRGRRTVAGMVDWFATGAHYFLVFEYVDGSDLQVLWAARPENNGDNPGQQASPMAVASQAFFKEEHFRRIFLCLLDAVAFCHRRGIVHRDIKMENVVVRDAGTSACLVDFGFAFLVHSPRTLLADASATSSLPPSATMLRQQQHHEFGADGDDPRRRRQRRRGRGHPPSERGDREAGDEHSHRTADAYLHKRSGGGSAHRDRRTVERSPAAEIEQGPRTLSACDPFVPDASHLLTKDDPLGWQMLMRFDRPDVLSDENRCIGTEDYCAPELTLGALVEPRDLFATDIYSLGVLLYASLTNQFPQHRTFAQYLVSMRYWLQQVWAGRDVRRALADPRLAAEINGMGAIDMGQWQGLLSPQVCDLMARMLRPLPAERITLQEICMHPWVVGRARPNGRPHDAYRNP